MRHSLRWHIAFPYAALILAATALLTLALAQSGRRVYLNNLDRLLQTEAVLISRDLSSTLTSSTALPEQTGSDLIQPQVIALSHAIQTRVTVIAPDGRVLGDSDEDPATMENHANRPEVRAALESGIGYSQRYSTTVGYMMRYVAVPVRTESGNTLAVVRVALPLEQIDATVRHFTLVVLLIGGGAALIAGLAGLLIAARVTQPIRELTATARAMATGALDRRVHIEAANEIGELARAFNEMARRLAGTFQRLQEEGATMSAVLATMQDAVCVTDAQGRLQLLNAAALRLFDTDSDQALGRSFLAVSQDHEMVEALRLCLDTGEARMAIIERPDDHRIFRLIATPVRPGPGKDASPGALLVLQDLTELRRLETVRRDFIANVSHELRTPLASIKAIVETLEDGALHDPAAARNFLTKMHAETEHLAQIVQELLDLARIESGQAHLALAPVSPSALINEVVERLHTQAERAGLTLTTAVEPHLPAISADRERVSRVLINLIDNAIKFTLPGGRITVAASRQGAGIAFSVADTGIGIDAENLPRIFERFYKADSARSWGQHGRTSSGTGLGLAIAKHIVQAHGGQIWAESRSGQGATFTFTLPVADQVAQARGRTR